MILMHYMLTENDCYLASKEEQDKLTEVVLAGGKLNRKCVGRDAKTLLSMIGVNAPANIRCIIFEGPKEHPLYLNHKSSTLYYRLLYNVS